MLTVYFPKTFNWDDAERWVAARNLPVTMHKGLRSSPFQGRTFSRYCNEIGHSDGRMVYAAHLKLRVAA